jgi:hypothetical protein
MNLNSLITGAARLGLALGARVLGLVRGRLGGSPRIDDETLRSRVEAATFASGRVRRHDVEIDVTEGVVWLRGEAASTALADECEARAGAVDGVVRVENLIRVARAQAEPPRAAAAPPAASAPPPTAEPVAEAGPEPAGATGAAGQGGSPRAPFPTVANGSGAGETSG